MYAQPNQNHPPKRIQCRTPKARTNERTHQVFSAIVDSGTRKIYTDQTGKFPVTSSRGNKYLFVLYDYDSNAILAEPIKSRKQDELLWAYQKLTQQLRKWGLAPNLQRLDNECSQAMKDKMDTQQIDWQLTPVGIHRRNAAERAIRTLKKHLLAGLASTDDTFQSTSGADWYNRQHNEPLTSCVRCALAHVSRPRPSKMGTSIIIELPLHPLE
jgi:hypothetical protein